MQIDHWTPPSSEDPYSANYNMDSGRGYRHDGVVIEEVWYAPPREASKEEVSKMNQKEGSNGQEPERKNKSD